MQVRAVYRNIVLPMICCFGISCSTSHQVEKASSVESRSASPTSGVPGFEKLGSPEARRKSEIVARFGKPLAEENLLEGKYSLLTYPVEGWNEKLIILLHGEELLGFARESSRSMLDSTMRHHNRSAGDRVVLYQLWSNGRTSYYLADRQQLERAPKWKKSSGTPPPLTQAEAERLAAEWFRRSRPNTEGVPRAREVLEATSVPGIAFYIVSILQPQRAELSEVVVLMDGTIIAGQEDANQ